MSYDITAIDTLDNIIEVEHHFITGGTYSISGTNEATLNITYNYSEIIEKVIWGGIKTLHDMKVIDSIGLLNKAIVKLNDDKVNDYWKATEGNVKDALKNLRELALLVLKVDVHSRWQVD